MLSVAQHNLITNPWKNTNYQLPPPLQRTSNRSRPRSLIILESECVGKGQQIFFIFTPDHELLLLWTREIERERESAAESENWEILVDESKSAIYYRFSVTARFQRKCCAGGGGLLEWVNGWLEGVPGECITAFIWGKTYNEGLENCRK